MKCNLSICLFVSTFILLTTGYGQEKIIYLENPSFEGTPAEGTLNGQMIKGWYDCGFPGETIPDIHPNVAGHFQVETKPDHGNTYIGMVIRDNETWERISQRLSSPMQGGKSYEFSISTARSLTYLSRDKKYGNIINFSTPAKLRIWGGNGFCDRSELLAESPLVIHTDWEVTTFRLKPEQNLEYLVFEAFYNSTSPFPYNGNILLDNASELVLVPPSLELSRYEFSEPAMGTEFRIILYASDPILAETAADEAFARIRELDQSMSNYLEESEINRLFATKKTYPDTVQVSADLWNVLYYGLSVSRSTQGAFDMTAGELTRLWRRAFRQKELPDKQEILDVLTSVGFDHIQLFAHNRIRIDHPDLRFDLGGIAKGYAVDKAFEILEANGMNIALVDGGGDIRIGAPPPGEEGWLIGLPDSSASESNVQPPRFSHISIATSGDTYRFFEINGKRLSHIIDPRNGQPVEFPYTVTVTAPTCMEADAWATALCVERDVAILGILEEKGIAAFFLQRK